MLFSKKNKPSAQSSARENFFSKKYTHAGIIINTTLPACYIYHFTLQIHKSSAQDYQNAEDTALLYYIEAQKIAAELAAISKYFSGSNNRTLDTLKRKSTATLFTIAAAFCSIIIEAYQKKVKG